MARRRTGSREHDSPGDRGHPAPEFLVHEVGQAPEEQPDRSTDGAQVAQRQPGYAHRRRDDRCSEQDTGEPAVKRHPAVPQREDLGGAAPVVAVAVEEHVAQSPADHHPHDRSQNDGDQVIVADVDLPARDQPPHHQTRAQEAQQVGDAVPANSERPDLKRDRVDGRERDGRQPHAVSSWSGRCDVVSIRTARWERCPRPARPRSTREPRSRTSRRACWPGTTGCPC